MDVPGARRTGGRRRANRRAGTTAQHGGGTIHHRIFRLLRTDEVDVAVDSARCHNHILACDNFCGGADAHRDIGLNIRVSRCADCGNLAALQPDIGLDDPPVVHNDCVGDNRIHHIGVVALRLTHAVTDRLAAAELHFFTIRGEIFLDFDKKFRISQADAITGSRAHHFNVSLTGNFNSHFYAPQWVIGDALLFQLAHHFLVESVDDPVSRELD